VKESCDREEAALHGGSGVRASKRALKVWRGNSLPDFELAMRAVL